MKYCVYFIFISVQTLKHKIYTYAYIIETLKYMHVKVKVPQSHPTLCNPMDYTDHGIFQARILEWVAFSFARGSSQPRDRTALQADFFTS